MQSIKTVRNQSILNLALQLYGNEDAVVELLAINDFKGNMVSPGFIKEDEVDIAYSLKEGVEVFYNEVSDLVNKQALVVIHGEKWQERNGLFIADGITKQSLKVHNNIYSDLYA